MPQDQNHQEDGEQEAPKAEVFDLDSILLPDKELHTPGNAQRANAGELLAQEQKAAAPAPVPAPPAPPPPKKEDSSIAPLETFESDIQKMLGGKDVSAVSIATAEAQRRAHPGPGAADMPEQESLEEQMKRIGIRIALYAGGALLIAAAASAVAYALLRPTSVPVNLAAQSPFISVDDSKTFVLQPSDGHGNVLQDLQSLTSAETLSPGLVASFIPTLASTTASAPAAAMSAQQFLPLLAPTMPTTLLRNVGANFLLGVHSFNGTNQPFLIFTTDSYEQGFASMLAWEPTMQQDLAPFFSAVSSLPKPSTVAATSTQVVTTGFTDQVVVNHDARVLYDQNGNTVLLWTFLDEQTIVVTTNQYTLGEIISRLKTSPITPVPGQ
jgi:hypothetical protein